MKTNYFKYMLLAATMTVMGASCSEESAHDDLLGIYSAPTDLSITSATTTDKTKDGNLRTFYVQFNTEQGTPVNMVMVSDQYYLLGTTYTVGEATKGHYLTASSINGSAVTDGSLNLSKTDDTYTISTSTLFTADGNAYRMKGSCELVYEPDDPTALTELKSATDNGDGTVTVVLSTGGWTGEFDMNTYQMVYTGGGNDLQIQFVTSDGKLHEGTYSPGTGYVAGYEYTYELWGMQLTAQAGTLWYTVADGVQTIDLITSGDIVVTKNGPLYTILLDQGKGGVYAQYTGTITDLDPDESGNVVIYNNAVNFTNYYSYGWGLNFFDIQLANGDIVYNFDMTTYTGSYTGSGDLLQLEIYTPDGTLADGEYALAADDASFTTGTFRAGYAGQYGNSGSYVTYVTDGVFGDVTYITEGTLKIETTSSGRSFTLSSGDTTYMGTVDLSGYGF